jgi:hypothetical protein
MPKGRRPPNAGLLLGPVSIYSNSDIQDCEPAAQIPAITIASSTRNADLSRVKGLLVEMPSRAAPGIHKPPSARTTNKWPLTSHG